MTQNPDFFDIPTVRVRTSAGEAELPIKYRDGSALTVFYTVAAERVLPLIDPEHLTHVRFRGGRAGIAVTWFEYRDTSIGPYNELSIAALVTTAPRSPVFPVLHMLRRDPRMGAHILHLPVTTEIARAGGCELYGYPKFVADIPIDWKQDKLHAELCVEGQRILAMEAPCRRGVDLPMADLTTFSLLDGHLVRTHIVTDCRAAAYSGKEVRLTVDPTDHEVAKTLRALDLASAKAHIVLYSDPFRSLLPLGETVRSHGARAA